jgi:hypothetical protein
MPRYSSAIQGGGTRRDPGTIVLRSTAASSRMKQSAGNEQRQRESEDGRDVHHFTNASQKSDAAGWG